MGKINRAAVNLLGLLIAVAGIILIIYTLYISYDVAWTRLALGFFINIFASLWFIKLGGNLFAK